LPLTTPASGATVRYIGERLAAGQVMPALAAARAGGERPARDELGAIVGDIFDALARNRVGIKLVDRSARDIPELGEIWFGGARSFLVEALTHYLGDRIRARKLRAPADIGVAARFIVETCAFWAVHRHWDAGPKAVDDDVARAVVIDLVTAALVLPAETQTPRSKRGAPK
jgi:hypothetical protein